MTRRSPIPELYVFLEAGRLRLCDPPEVQQPVGAGNRAPAETPVGRPPEKPIVCYHNFRYQAASWDKARRVVAKVEWHQGELFPRVGFIVTNLGGGAAERGVVLQRARDGGAVDQGRQERGELDAAVVATTSRTIRRGLQLFALAYNLGNFLRRLALPVGVKHWSMTTSAGEADQDRGKSGASRPVGGVPDGGGGGAPRVVPADPGKNPATSARRWRHRDDDRQRANLAKFVGRRWQSVRRASKNRRKCQNEGEGRPNQRNYGGYEPRIFLFHAPDLGILCKMADDVRRRSFIWEISVKINGLWRHPEAWSDRTAIALI